MMSYCGLPKLAKSSLLAEEILRSTRVVTRSLIDDELLITAAKTLILADQAHRR